MTDGQNRRDRAVLVGVVDRVSKNGTRGLLMKFPRNESYWGSSVTIITVDPACVYVRTRVCTRARVYVCAVTITCVSLSSS